MTDSNAWTTIKLGDVASDINERVANPSQSGYDRFVGLDHLTSGDLTVRNWGSSEDVTSSMKLFKKGDVLLGRRNTYLKRASMADFDGVCSGDAYVLRANKKYLVDGYLPLILNSSDLWDYANAYSAGGMSKRAKWRDLANYEFSLPPLEEQKRIAEILWAAEDVIVKNETFLAEAEHYKQLMMRDLFHKGIGHTEFKDDKKIGMVPKHWSIVNVGSIVKTFYNGGTPSTNNKDYWNGDIPWTTSAPMEGFFIEKGEKYISKVGLENSATHLIPANNVLISTRVGIGKIAINLIDISISQDLTGCLLDKEQILPRFFVYYFKGSKIQLFLNNIAQGTTIKGITRDKIEQITIPLPPLTEQKQIAAILTQIDETIAAARETIESTKALKMKLINELLSQGDGYVQQ